jgi:protein TonB
VRVEPEYPQRAKHQGIEGWVELEFTISPAGTVKNPRVIHAQPASVFDQAALSAVRRWRYNPRIEEGVAVAREGVQVRMRFELDGAGR